MEYGFSILMFSFAALLLLYALILCRTKDPRRIPRNRAVKMTQPLEYAKRFAKAVALVALAPLLSGVLGLFAGPWVPGVVLVLGLIVTVALALRMGKNDDE